MYGNANTEAGSTEQREKRKGDRKSPLAVWRGGITNTGGGSPAGLGNEDDKEVAMLMEGNRGNRREKALESPYREEVRPASWRKQD